MKIKPGGFSEAGISTSNLDRWIEFLTGVGAYETIWRGESSPSLNRLWGLAPETRVTECLLGCPGTSSGYIRLFFFDGIDQDEIRNNTGCRDSGGIFDLDIRVPAVQPFVGLLKERGWTDFSRPVDWPFGQLQVREWLSLGPDSAIFALIERLSPPLEGFDGLKAFSHVFNSSQIVSDMVASIGFYEKLGFSKILHHTGPLAGQGGEVLGLGEEEAPATPVELVILQPDGVMSGSIELVKIDGAPGQDVSAKSLPYNLGLNLLRFPVSDARAYAEQLERDGLRLSGPAIRARIEPLGEVELFAIRTPDGAWLEFYSIFPPTDLPGSSAG